MMQRLPISMASVGNAASRARLMKVTTALVAVG